MYESRQIELDLLSNNLIEKYYLSKFNKQQTLNLSISEKFKLNNFEITYFLDRVRRNIKLRNKRKLLIKEKNKIPKNMEQIRLC